MESFLADLKKDVQCSLCNDTLIEPKILQCFHTFCKLCIKRHAELIEEANVFKCPKCLSETCLPELSSVDDLQPSLVHSRILKGLALVESEKICSVSESHSPASWYCFDCDHSLCPECENNHSFFIKDHKVVCLTDLKREDIELIIKRENNCKSHPNQRLELFCEDCDSMICLTCLKHVHKGHKQMPLDEFASIKKAVLSKHLELLEHLRLDDKEKQEQEEIASIIKQDGERAKREVKDKTKEMIDILQENERELLRQIDDKLNTAKRNLNIIHHIPAVKEYINNAMERGLASEMIDIHGSEKFIFNPIPQYSRIIFVPNEEVLQQVNSGLGGIQTYSKTDHMMIQVESEPEALRKEKLILTTKTPTGELNDDTINAVDVKISPEDNVKIEEKYARTDGKIEVEFMPKVPGQLTAGVKVNGNHVSNSPLVMNVKPQQMRITREFNMKGTNTGSQNYRGIAVNKENSRIAVADHLFSCVHVLNTDGDLLLTYGSRGSGQGQLSVPRGVAFLNETDLVIADCSNHRICIVNTTTGTLVKTFGNLGNGNGELCNPYGVHVDDDCNIIVSDTCNNRVQVFTKDGDYQYQFGLTKQDKFDPVRTVTHRGLFYVSDFINNVIRVFEKEGNVPTRISTIWWRRQC